jgi:DNA polymerase I-like protein with 3'-5' exonuclease and polymerase domains
MPVTKTSHPKKKCFKNHPDLVETEMVVTVKAVLLPFNCASPKQLLEYMKHKGHKVIMKRNKPTTDEKALKLLQGKYPEDKLYPLVLERRKLDKLAGTYVGRLEEVTD